MNCIGAQDDDGEVSMDEKLDFAQVCRDIEDYLVPHLRLGAGERALYYHLMRLSHAEGVRRAHVSKRVLARGIGCSTTTVNGHLRRLTQKGCVRIVERGLLGHVLEVLTPGEIPGCMAPATALEDEGIEAVDCFKNEKMRAAIVRRERNACFYCLRQMRTGAAVFDHVVPAAAGGDNAFRNIVACCFDCNSRKGGRAATEFLRELYRASRLSEAEFDARLAALEALQSGQLVPAM
jgi:predicted DNA-binding transcriptional regulator